MPALTGGHFLNGEIMMDHTKELEVLQSIRAQMEEIPGHTGFYYKNLTTGMEYGVRAQETFLAASVIKLPLYLHVLRRVEQGSLSMDQTVTVTAEDKVPICGALTLFTGDVTVDIRTLCRLMISLSDNTATNVLIRLCGIEETSEAFRAMGLELTVIRRRLYDRAASLAGIQNTISPQEMGMLLEQLYRNEFATENTCKEAMETLDLQQVDHKLNGKLCGRVRIAHKTGEDDELSNDVGIVFAKEPFIICFAGHDTDVYRWEDLMRRGTYELVEAQKE